MSDQITPENVAGNMYTSYCIAVGGKAFNGDPLPSWEEFSTDPKKQLQSNAWIVAAKTAIQMLR